MRTIIEEKEVEIVEKKSRFIASIYHVETKEEAESIINIIKKKYYDAKHNCFAFIINENNLKIERQSDDGEPQGTAGAPLLNILRKKDLENVLLIVTRYFGGILLGTGGLTRAYNEAGIKVVEKAEIIEFEEGLEIKVEVSYDYNDEFKYILEKNKIDIIETNYNEKIEYILELNVEKYELLENIRKNKEYNDKILKITKNCSKLVKIK